MLRLYLVFRPPFGWFICYALISWVTSTSLFQTCLPFYLWLRRLKLYVMQAWGTQSTFFENGQRMRFFGKLSTNLTTRYISICVTQPQQALGIVDVACLDET